MKSSEIQKGFKAKSVVEQPKPVTDYKALSGAKVNLAILAGFVAIPIILETISLINSKVK